MVEVDKMKKSKPQSLQNRIVLCVIGVLLLMILMMVIHNAYASSIVKKQIIESYRNSISMVIDQTDERLAAVDRYLASLLVTDYNAKIIRVAGRHDEATFASVRLQNSLAATLAGNQVADAFFTFDTASEMFFDTHNENSSYVERESVRAYLRKTLTSQAKPELLGDKWSCVEIDGNYYILRVMSYGSLCVGAWINAKTFYLSMHALNTGDRGTVFLTKGDRTPMTVSLPKGISTMGDYSKGYETGENKNFWIIGRQSECGEFILMAMISNEKITEGMPQWYVYLLILLLCAPAAIALLLLILRHSVMWPVQELARVFQAFGSGNTDSRANVQSNVREFNFLGREFNDMADRINTLQFRVYEERLSRQQFELQYLQKQVNPHFCLNCLNTIYSFAVSGENEKIRETLLALSSYLRYLFKNSFTFVTLCDELEHIKNYLHIQQIRYPDMLEAIIEVPDVLQNIEVPSMLLQTFVENTAKHALSAQNRISIRITASILLEAEQPQLRIFIYDNGCGFDPAVLENFQTGNPFVDAFGKEHVGIWNLAKRIELLYGQQAQLRIFNFAADGTGAAAEIKLPIRTRGQ